MLVLIIFPSQNYLVSPIRMAPFEFECCNQTQHGWQDNCVTQSGCKVPDMSDICYVLLNGNRSVVPWVLKQCLLDKYQIVEGKQIRTCHEITKLPY